MSFFDIFHIRPSRLPPAEPLWQWSRPTNIQLATQTRVTHKHGDRQVDMGCLDNTQKPLPTMDNVTSSIHTHVWICSECEHEVRIIQIERLGPVDEGLDH
jgi:hypothetical protein